MAPASLCRARLSVVRGQEFIVRGADLGMVKRVVFGGSDTKRDDSTSRVTRRGDGYVVGVVPSRARSGPVILQGADKSRLGRVTRVAVRRALPARDVAPGTGFFYGGRRRASFVFDVRSATTARVELINDDSQAVVRSWAVPAEPGRQGRVTWDGRGAAGTVEPPGRYSFRVAGAAQSAVTAAPGSASSFFFADHVFPIRGRHDLGQSATNNFGGDGKRRHMGQDMFARCGTKLAAARGGRVQFAGYHSAAGNYLVIDGAGTGTDYIYMHMRRPALVRTGDRVFTGQKVGEIGETGRATGCQLHFEMWSGPGWYEGGKAFDPLPSARAWDSYS